MDRHNRKDWLTHGLRVLGEAGAAGLTIDRLAGDLGVTKGSFYHHFRSGSDFEERLIAFWAESYMSAMQSLPEAPGELLALLDMVMEQAFGTATEPEVAIRTWAQHDARVRPHVERVDAARLGFVRRVFGSIEKDAARADLMAQMLFTMLIGEVVALPRLSHERAIEMYREFKRVYGLPDAAGTRPSLKPPYGEPA